MFQLIPLRVQPTWRKVVQNVNFYSMRQRQYLLSDLLNQEAADQYAVLVISGPGFRVGKMCGNDVTVYQRDRYPLSRPIAWLWD
jgi:hypothetical protein